MITETENTVYSRQDAVVNSAVTIPDDPEITVVDGMTSLGQSRKDAQRLMRQPAVTTSINSPKLENYIGCWNVRTMFSIGKAAQVAREMNKARCEILGLSEVRWTGFVRVELGSGESIIFSGREDDMHRSGVAIMMSEKAKKSLLEWKPINERIIVARFNSAYIKISMVQVYAPTEDNPDEEKDVFYETLQTIVSQLPRHDIKIITGDFNAKTGKDNTGIQEIMGKHGMGSRNNNGKDW